MERESRRLKDSWDNFCEYVRRSPMRRYLLKDLPPELLGSPRSEKESASVALTGWNLRHRRLAYTGTLVARLRRGRPGRSAANGQSMSLNTQGTRSRSSTQRGRCAMFSRHVLPGGGGDSAEVTASTQGLLAPPVGTSPDVLRADEWAKTIRVVGGQ